MDAVSDSTDSVYTPLPTGTRFHHSAAEVRVLCGPLGTGKTAILINDTKYIMHGQAPRFSAAYPNGIKETAFCFVRDTQAELKGAIIDQLPKWFDDSIIEIRQQPDRAYVNYVEPNGCVVNAKFEFVGMDTEKSIKRLKSRNYTSTYLNEAQYSHRWIRDVCHERAKRYPSDERGINCTFGGLAIDCNPPPLSHWVIQDYWFGTQRNARGEIISEFFNVPPPLIRVEGYKEGGYFHNGYTYFKNPQDEASFLHDTRDPDTGLVIAPGTDYWLNLLPNYTDRDIRSLILGEFVGESIGKPVYGESFNPEKHVAKSTLTPMQHTELLLSFDFGHHSACTVHQYWPDGRWAILRELYAGSLGLTNLLNDLLLPLLRHSDFSSLPIRVIHDPTGDKKLEGSMDLKQSEKVARFLNNLGKRYSIEPAATNNWERRHTAVEFSLERQSGVLIDPDCTMVVDGFAGEYVYPSNKAGLLLPQPDKDSKYSHIFDTVEYAAMDYLGSDDNYTGVNIAIAKHRHAGSR